MRIKKVVLILIALFVVQGLISRAMFPTWQKEYSAGKGNVGIAQGLSADQLLASVSGLRQMVAGLLWVQSDTYFHEGQFDAILPLIRLITWLDPKQLEVYITGSWHIAYNFTDEQNRSDRRYIPLALALLDEGVKYNPDTYHLYHQTGWIYYHKIDDEYPEAVRWFERSVQMPDVLPALRSILANAYLKNGQLDEAVAWYRKLELEALEKVSQYKEGEDMGYDRIFADVYANNVNNNLIRMASRGVFARRDGVYDKYPYDTHNPVDLNFSVKIEVLQPKVLRISGTWGIPSTGARIRCVLRDADYVLAWKPAPQGLDFDIDRDKTYMQDQLYTQNRQFDRKIDMSRNPTMYPFKSDNYKIEFYFSPRSAPAHIQDKIGWDGEGMTDKRYYRTDLKDGYSVLFASFDIPRDMILRKGEYKHEAAIRSDGYVEIVPREHSDILERIPLRK